MNIKVKLCGIRRLCETDCLNEYPPDYAGFVFAHTRRYVSPADAAELRENLSDRIKTVGVFVNEPLENMPVFRDIISVYQLHGNEDNEYIAALRKIIPADCEIWKAVRVRSADDIVSADGYNADKLLFDAFSADEYGGTGKVFNHGLFSGTEIKKPFFLAGGLNAANLAESVSKVSPFGVDISSGIETDGVKDNDKTAKIMEIISNIRLTLK